MTAFVEDNIVKTTIVPPFGLREFCRMPFVCKMLLRPSKVSWMLPAVVSWCLYHLTITPLRPWALFQQSCDHGLVINPLNPCLARLNWTSWAIPLLQMVQCICPIPDTRRYYFTPASPQQEILAPVCWPDQLLPSFLAKVHWDFTATASNFSIRHLHLYRLLPESLCRS